MPLDADAPAATELTTWQQRVGDAIVCVGVDRGPVGRGLLISAGAAAFVLTCCHALPYVPDDCRPLPQILCRLGAKNPTTGAAVLFADMATDVALLLPDEAMPLSAETALEIVLGNDTHDGAVRMPGRHEMQDAWLRYDGATAGRQLQLSNASHEVLTAGLSGSPMFDDDNRLVGVYVARARGVDRAYAAAVPATLPLWLVRLLEVHG